MAAAAASHCSWQRAEVWRGQNHITLNLFWATQQLVAFRDWFIPFASGFGGQSKTLGLHNCNYFLSATVNQWGKTWAVVKLENSLFVAVRIVWSVQSSSACSFLVVVFLLFNRKKVPSKAYSYFARYYWNYKMGQLQQLRERLVVVQLSLA